MSKFWLKIILAGIIAITIAISLTFFFGATDIIYTKTIGKEKQNAQREVFEETQSYVEGKRQEALKLYREYLEADEDGKLMIKEIVVHSFAQFDEDKLKGKVKDFVYDCKYKP